MSDGRPITILGCLNRLYSCIICDQIAPIISHQPLGVACKVVAQMTLCSPSRIRLKAGSNSQPMNGFVLDLVKAFNTIS